MILVFFLWICQGCVKVGNNTLKCLDFLVGCATGSEQGCFVKKGFSLSIQYGGANMAPLGGLRPAKKLKSQYYSTA